MPVKVNCCMLVVAVLDTDREPVLQNKLGKLRVLSGYLPLLNPFRVHQVPLVFLPDFLFPYGGGFLCRLFRSGWYHTLWDFPSGTPPNLFTQFVPSYASLEFVGNYLAVFFVLCDACH